MNEPADRRGSRRQGVPGLSASRVLGDAAVVLYTLWSLAAAAGTLLYSGRLAFATLAPGGVKFVVAALAIVALANVPAQILMCGVALPHLRRNLVPHKRLWGIGLVLVGA